MDAFKPGSDSAKKKNPVRGSSRRYLLSAFKWIAGVVVFPILLGAIVLVFFVNSDGFHSYLLGAIQTQAAAKLGVPVVLQNFTLHLSTLSVDLYGLTVSGAEPHPSPPLLQVQHIQSGVKVVSVFKRKWYLDNLRIDRPVIQVYVDSRGRSNIPAFKSSGGSNTTIFDLGIRHAVIDGGVVYYNDQPSALSADLHDVNLDSVFNEPLRRYSGTLSYRNGRFWYGSMSPPTHTISVKFDADPNTLHLAPADLIVGKSRLTLNAALANYNAPAIQAQYNLIADGAEISQALHNPSIPAGLISARGSLQYRQAPNRALLESLEISGELTSGRLDARAPNARTSVTNLVAHYSLAEGDATLRDLRANILGGEITAQGVMKNLAGDSHSQFSAALRGISLTALRRTLVPANTVPEIDLSGTLNATATGSWGKTIDDLVARADAMISAKASGSQIVTQQRGATQQTADSAGAIPVESVIHAIYTAKGERLSINNSYLRTPQTNLAMDGIVSKASSLNVQLQANDLHEIETIADIFRTPAANGSHQSFGLAGTASFTGRVQGSTSAPHLTGQLAAQSLQFDGTNWKVFRTNVDASPTGISLSHSDLEPASHGKLAFNASAGLTKWAFTDSSPLQVQLNASQLDIADLTKLAGQQTPVIGTLNANITLHGTRLNPTGNGNVTLDHVTAYGEPVTSAEATFSGAENAVHADLVIQAPAGSIKSKLTVHPTQKTYTANLTSDGIHLDKLHSVGGTEDNITGIVTLNAKGEGSFDNPQGDAVIQIPSLSVRDQKITDIKLQINVANRVATANLTSSAVGTAIRGSGHVNLTGDYQADATVDTQSIALQPLLAAYLPAQADNINGQTELHATLHGPLKDRQRLEAHATIPFLRLAYGTDVQLAANAPIHVDLKDGLVNVERSRISGTDTDLQFQAKVPTTGDTPMSLLLVGTIGLNLAQLLSPDLRSSGQLRFNVNSDSLAPGQRLGGTIEIVDVSMSTADVPLGLQHTNGTLAFTNDRVNITALKGTLGGGSLAASGGVVFSPAVRFDMGLEAKGVRMLYPQGMRETMDANMRLTGTPQRALIGGNVNISDVSFTPAFDLNRFIGQLTGGVEAPPSRGVAQNIALNVAVRSSNNVNLVSRTLSIAGSANLQLRGTLAEPVILGRANLTGGDVLFSNKRFVLTGGTVQFVNPSQTEPNVNLSLSTTIQQYNVRLRFEGPVDQLRTQYTSDPSLPSADIINLLAFGQTTEASAANPTPTNQAAQSVVASQVSNQVTSRVSRIAGISQLSINPVLPNSSGSGQMGANITIQQRVTGNLFITYSTNVASTESQTIQGQYQVTPRVGISATRDANGGFAVDTLIKKTW